MSTLQRFASVVAQQKAKIKKLTIVFSTFLNSWRSVLVIDENDETPVFEPRSGCVSITEFHDSRVPITTIHARDRDDPALPNGHIVFSIEGGNDAGLFSVINIDPTSARLLAGQPLVGHHGNYTLRLRAQDRGAVPNVAFQDVEVCVTDFNDHAPMFVRPEQNNTTLRVFENATIGSIITTVSAIDKDAGLNSQVRYSIRPVGHWKWFEIDSVTGEISLAQPLDREKQKLLQVSDGWSIDALYKIFLLTHFYNIILDKNRS